MTVKQDVLIIRGGIYSHVLDKVSDQTSGSRGDHLYLVLDTYGGAPGIGYRTLRLLQAKYAKITAIVPNYAYSTGTLMALGCDFIYMNRSACLGPLDTQIPHPTDGTMISSLEIRDTMNTLVGFVQSYSATFADNLRNKISDPLGKNDAWELAMKTSVELIKPIVEKIDPIQLQSSSRSSTIGQKYAESLLSSRMMKDNQPLARLVSHYLAHNYDDHAYAIVLEEVTDRLALSAADLADCEHWAQIESLFVNTNDTDITMKAIYLEEPSPDQESKNTQTTSKNKDINNDKGAKT